MKGRRVASIAELTYPGDYCGPIMGHHHVDPEKDRPSILFRLPIETDDPRTRSIYRVAQPPHVFRECPDGSVEVRESIAAGSREPGDYYWHGYLDEGHVWRTA